MRIATDGTANWNAHAAWVHLRLAQQKLVADLSQGADPQVVAADRAAVIESRRQVADGQGRRLLDVSV
jgi:hypothetical protein